MSKNILQKLSTIHIPVSTSSQKILVLLLLLSSALFIRIHTEPSLFIETQDALIPDANIQSITIHDSAINGSIAQTDSVSTNLNTDIDPILTDDTVNKTLEVTDTEQTFTDNLEDGNDQINFDLPEISPIDNNNNTQQAPTATQSSSSPKPELFILDTIVAVVMNDEGTEIVTLSYTKRPSLSGAQRTLEDIVFELLVFLDATKHKITPDNDAVDKYLETVQKENNLTREQLEEIFAQSGYTFEEALKEFKKMQANNIMLEYKIKSNLVVPRKKIEKYFEENPEILEASYELEYALVPFDPSISKKDQLKMLIDTISNTPDTCTITWGNPFWVTKGELAEEKYFLTDLPVCGISAPEQIENGFELYRLKNKNNERLKTIEERYTEIANILRRPRYAKLIDEYKEQLFATSSVKYF